MGLEASQRNNGRSTMTLYQCQDITKMHQVRYQGILIKCFTCRLRGAVTTVPGYEFPALPPSQAGRQMGENVGKENRANPGLRIGPSLR